jgi:nucleotide-binding universal stress UspA family protein
MERILVCLDGSAQAEEILPALRTLLDRHAAELVLVRAVEPMPVMHEMPGYAPPIGEVAAGAQREAEGYLRRVAGGLAGLSVRTLVRTATPARAIAETALTEEASLVAMVTHGRRGLGRLVAGSVTESVLRQSPVPMFVLRAGTPVREAPLGRILAPIADDDSLGMLPMVKRFAGLHGAEVILMHVLVDVAHDVPFPRHGLQAAQEELAAAGIPCAREFRHGDPAIEILSAAHDLNVGAIAMATHARRGLRRWFRGSVTEHVMRRSPAPMLVARAAIPARIAQPSDRRISSDVPGR